MTETKPIQVHRSTVDRLAPHDKTILDELVRLGRAAIVAETPAEQMGIIHGRSSIFP